MSIQEALSIISKDNKRVIKLKHSESQSTFKALRYLFGCYNRILVEERQFPKVRTHLQK